MKTSIFVWTFCFLAIAGGSLAQEVYAGDMDGGLTKWLDQAGLEAGRAPCRYVRAGAGGGDGMSWATAWPALPAALERGCKYYVADGQYGSYTFDDPPSSPGGPKFIIVQKATELDHGESATWHPAFGDGVAVFNGPIQFTTPYWVFHGAERDTSSSGHGFKIDASNGNKGVQISTSASASFIAVLFTEIAGCGDDGDANGNDLVYVTQNVRYIIISHCHLHDAGRCPFLFRDCDGIIQYCHIARNESTPAQHAEGISAAWDTVWIVRNNYWEDIEGTGVIVFYGHHWMIFGNVFFNTPGAATNPFITNGAITTWKDAQAGTVHSSFVYNNTFVNLNGYNAGVFFNSSSYGNKAYNNVFYKCDSVDHLYVEADWNWYCGNGSGNYQSEAHSEYPQSDPLLFVDPAGCDFHLTKGTLNGRDNLVWPFTIDMDDVRRGTDGVWDRGAFEFCD